MDKRIIFAVAGSGKTTYLINCLTLDKRYLILTYTTNNFETIRNYIIEKFGYFPENIKLQTYFGFLYSFCFKPLLSYKVNPKGINWKSDYPPYLKNTDKKFYLDQTNRLYYNRIAKLCEVQNILPDINERLERYFDCLLIDEIQDFAGHDFNLLKSISQANCEMFFVGDFYQHTYSTSYDGNVNIRLFNDYNSYTKEFDKMGFVVDTDTLQKSYRCSKTVCDFIQSQIGIQIYSSTNRDSKVKVIENRLEAESIIHDNSIIKLFYQAHYKYNCYSMNWGCSKGINGFNDVCVVLNKATKQAFDKLQIKCLPPQTKNKFYVACSRANNDLFFISEEYAKKTK
ncbi:MAG: UvrD-helicase domain-containing protein [Candidatus Cloacimonetes bacterium]|nr:UvrD-helicase domain-containing protein [Candidatus Cloacimonadota bacterium]